MTQKIQQLIKENWAKLPAAAGQPKPAGRLWLTKFHHGQANQQSKVLFLATYQGRPLCLVKIGRGAAADEKLRQEKVWQEKFAASAVLAAPRVYFDGEINGRYCYAEEAVLGRPLGIALARRREKEIIGIIGSFERAGEVPSAAVAGILKNYQPSGEPLLASLIEKLAASQATLSKSFSHGDLTRKNILAGAGKLILIDWDRANQRPFWLLDAAHFMVTLRNTQAYDDWAREAKPLFVGYTGVSGAMADALYFLEASLVIFCNKYPREYANIVATFKSS